MNALLARVIESLATKLLSYVGGLFIEWLDEKKDNKEIDDAFSQTDEGAVAGGLNAVFRD